MTKSLNQYAARESDSRPLDLTETMFALGNVFVGYSARCRGHVDLDALTVAFAALRTVHPVLAGHIESRDDERLLVVRTDDTIGTRDAVRVRHGAVHQFPSGTHDHVDSTAT